MAAAAALSVRLLPPEPVHEQAPEAPGAAGGPAGQPALPAGDQRGGLIQAAHAFHYGFSALVWKGQGLDEAVTRALWATGVGAEVVFLWFLEAGVSGWALSGCC